MPPPTDESDITVLARADVRVGRPESPLRQALRVAFSEWTDEGRLRHPSFQGLRHDKQPRDVVRER